MAIQNRRGNFADFDPYKMLAGEFAYALDTEELYYCVSPGNVKRCATKEDVIEILETSQDAYNGLQQLLTELEDETVLTGLLNDISTLLDDVAINKSNIASNAQDIENLDTRVSTNTQDVADLDATVNAHLAENAKKHITESGSNQYGRWTKFDNGLMICEMYIENTIKVDVAWGSMFYGKLSDALSYPQPFSDVPNIALGGRQFRSFWAESLGSTRYTTGTINIYKPVADTTALEYTLGITAIGRWK